MSVRLPVWQLITGRQFNKLTRGVRFYKLTFPNELHRGFIYQSGLNVDTENFVPFPHCAGLHFTEERFIGEWLDLHQRWGTPLKYKREVKLADHAKVYFMYDEVKADQLILGPREDL